MSDEITTLDWLARNVSDWGDAFTLLVSRQPARYYSVNYDQERMDFTGADCDSITKDQWLARRAELQNKPSWDDAPEWAISLVQTDSGSWVWIESETPKRLFGSGDKFEYSGNSGFVLGAWRDTLEKRPEEFKPFTSIEDNQDREGANQKLNELEMLGKVSHLISDKRHRITTSKYTKTIHGVPVDVYDVLMAWGVTNPALQHLIKKALQCGQRGHKDNAQDLQDIIDSAIRAKELG